MSIKSGIAAFRKMSLVRQVLYGAVVVVAGFGIYTAVSYVQEQPTRNFQASPQGTVQLVNADGGEYRSSIRVLDTPNLRREGLQKVRPEVASEKPVLFVYRVNTTVRHSFNDVRVPLEIAFFTDEGVLNEIHSVEPGTASLRPAERYRFALMAPPGYFEANGIGMDMQTALVPDSVAVASR